MGTCSNASGCSGAVGDQFDGGEVNTFGAEFAAETNLAESFTNAFKVPLKLTYTHTRAEFRNSFVSSYDIWGTVNVGDKLPYVAENTLYASIGFNKNKLNADISLRYQDSMDAVAGGATNTDAHTVYDAAVNYKLHKNLSIYGNVQNIFDDTYIAARNPAGIRVGAPRIFFIGAKLAY